MGCEDSSIVKLKEGRAAGEADNLNAASGAL